MIWLSAVSDNYLVIVMKKFFSIILAIISVFSVCAGLSACSKEVESTPVSPEDFRITAYIVSDNIDDSFDPSNIDRLTDIILIGNADYDEEGNVILADKFEDDLAVLRKYITNQNLYLNILGPSTQSDSDDWNEQMYDLADRNTRAFESGKLENSIKSVLDKYNFDGVVFDYEFPLRNKDWKAFDKFIINLDETLGDEYKIGMSMVSWNLKQSKEAMDATDFFEVMSYDLWDDDGYHATLDIAKDDIDAFVKAGYDKADLDLGVPFYARPTTEEAYWYDYKKYYDKLSDDGLYYDDETKLTFSFNTYDVIEEKTRYAIDNGVGGMMVWHYSCDLPADNDKSLFKAMYSVKQNSIAAEKK